MPENIIDIPESGEIEVHIGKVKYTLDAYQTHNELLSIRVKMADEDKPIEEFHQTVVEYLQGKGLPKFNHFQADQFVTQVQKAVEKLGKGKGEAVEPDRTPVSPATTAQPPSTSQAE